MGLALTEGIKLWVDDKRTAPAGWRRARTIVEALVFLYTEKIEEIVLDHDLGKPNFRDAELISYLIEDLAQAGKIPRMKWQIVSDNGPGINNIYGAMHSADKHWFRHEELRATR